MILFWCISFLFLSMVIYINYKIVPWQLWNRWENCLIICSSISFFVTHIYREVNHCADTLVGVGLSLQTYFWWDEIPNQIRLDFARNKLGNFLISGSVKSLRVLVYVPPLLCFFFFFFNGVSTGLAFLAGYLFLKKICINFKWSSKCLRIFFCFVFFVFFLLNIQRFDIESSDAKKCVMWWWG